MSEQTATASHAARNWTKASRLHQRHRHHDHHHQLFRRLDSFSPYAARHHHHHLSAREGDGGHPAKALEKTAQLVNGKHVVEQITLNTHHMAGALCQHGRVNF